MTGAASILLGLVGAAVLAYGVYIMIHGGRDDSGGAPGDRGGLGPIPERGIHVLAGLRIAIFGVLCLTAAAFALTRF
ncbi:hypothetical protein BH20ACT11_BH20ACT11_03180 [soil metagenome]